MSTKIIKLYIVQIVNDGVPSEPVVITTYREFSNVLIATISEEGFRLIKKNETVNEYYDAYLKHLNSGIEPSLTIHKWEKVMRIESKKRKKV